MEYEEERIYSGNSFTWLRYNKLWKAWYKTKAVSKQPITSSVMERGYQRIQKKSVQEERMLLGIMYPLSSQPPRSQAMTSF